MTRARISTTVDADVLTAARRRFGGRDADLLDTILASWLRDQDAEAERRAIAAAPYDRDPDLDIAPADATTPDLAYGSGPPPSVIRLARARRVGR